MLSRILYSSIIYLVVWLLLVVLGEELVNTYYFFRLFRRIPLLFYTYSRIFFYIYNYCRSYEFDFSNCSSWDLNLLGYIVEIDDIVAIIYSKGYYILRKFLLAFTVENICSAAFD